MIQINIMRVNKKEQYTYIYIYIYIYIEKLQIIQKRAFVLKL